MFCWRGALKLVGLAAITFTGGCQTSYTYQRIGAGPELHIANARCEIMSTSVDQGVVAWGTPAQVLGAQIGNELANASRRDQFMKNCMILQGWARTPSKQ